MRRIIERVVTVVTTTTWTISWQDDPPHPESQADSVDGNLSQSQSLEDTQRSNQIDSTRSAKEEKTLKQNSN